MSTSGLQAGRVDVLRDTDGCTPCELWTLQPLHAVHMLDGMPLDGLARIAPSTEALQIEGTTTDEGRDKFVVEECSPAVDEYPMPEETGFSVRKYWRAEAKLMMQLSLPCILANTSTQIMVITSQIFVGTLGVAPFAAAALANTVSGKSRCFARTHQVTHAS